MSIYDALSLMTEPKPDASASGDGSAEQEGAMTGPMTSSLEAVPTLDPPAMTPESPLRLSPRDLLDIRELDRRVIMGDPTYTWTWPPSDTSVSDRNVKENVAAVDPQALLRDLVALPIHSWNYIADPQTRHIGPMAQDFRGAFGLGDSDRTIHNVDANGVTVAALQGLYQLLQESNAQLAEARGRIDQLESQLATLAQSR